MYVDWSQEYPVESWAPRHPIHYLIQMPATFQSQSAPGFKDDQVLRMSSIRGMPHLRMIQSQEGFLRYSSFEI